MNEDAARVKQMRETPIKIITNLTSNHLKSDQVKSFFHQVQIIAIPIQDQCKCDLRSLKVRLKITESLT